MCSLLTVQQRNTNRHLTVAVFNMSGTHVSLLLRTVRHICGIVRVGMGSSPTGRWQQKGHGVTQDGADGVRYHMLREKIPHKGCQKHQQTAQVQQDTLGVRAGCVHESELSACEVREWVVVSINRPWGDAYSMVQQSANRGVKHAASVEKRRKRKRGKERLGQNKQEATHHHTMAKNADRGAAHQAALTHIIGCGLGRHDLLLLQS